MIGFFWYVNLLLHQHAGSKKSIDRFLRIARMGPVTQFGDYNEK